MGFRGMIWSLSHETPTFQGEIVNLSNKMKFTGTNYIIYQSHHWEIWIRWKSKQNVLLNTWTFETECIIVFHHTWTLLCFEICHQNPIILHFKFKIFGRKLINIPWKSNHGKAIINRNDKQILFPTSWITSSK